MAEEQALVQLMKRIERLADALDELEGNKDGKDGRTRDGVKWNPELEALAVPSFGRIVSVLEGLTTRFTDLVHDEGVARLGARLKREGDHRDPFAVYWEGKAHPTTGGTITEARPGHHYSRETHGSQPRRRFDLRTPNQRNREFWDAQRAQMTSTPTAATASRTTATPGDANVRNAAFWAKQGIRP